jgi:hypothetical protein
MSVEIDGISHWKDGTRAKLVGYEEGTVTDLRLHHTNYGNNDERWKSPYQTIFLRFVAERVVSPKDLALKKRQK